MYEVPVKWVDTAIQYGKHRRARRWRRLFWRFYGLASLGLFGFIFGASLMSWPPLAWQFWLLFLVSIYGMVVAAGFVVVGRFKWTQPEREP
jgi:cobalamin biosynthesis protein CobD/CbiB